ncbi:hypothetical protein BC332_05384 [Capsicum chinense]|nr:hypothetical protein BC332_05384 [Capsicum chinense]
MNVEKIQAKVVSDDYAIAELLKIENSSKIDSEYNEDQAFDECPQWVESEVLVKLHSIQNENTTKIEILNPHLDSRLYVLAIEDTIPKLTGLNDLSGYYNVMKHLESAPSSALVKVLLDMEIGSTLFDIKVDTGQVFWALYDRGKLGVYSFSRVLLFSFVDGFLFLNVVNAEAKLPTPVVVKSENWDECALALIKITATLEQSDNQKQEQNVDVEASSRILTPLQIRKMAEALLKKKMKEMKVGSAQGCFFRVKTVNTLSKVHGQICSVEVNWTSKLLYLLVNIGLKDPGTQSDLVEKWVEYEDVGQCVLVVLTSMVDLQMAKLHGSKVYVNHSNVDDYLINSFVRSAADPNAYEVYYRLLRQLMSNPTKYTLDSVLSQLFCPLLLLWGDLDPWVHDHAKPNRIKDFYPNTSLVNLQAGHYPQDEVPEQVNKALLDWLSALEISSPSREKASEI